MDCTVCMEKFDHFEHQPIVLNCGHTCCKHCVKSILTSENSVCPFDRKTIKNNKGLQLNLALLDLLKKKQESEILELPEYKAECEVSCPQNHVFKHFTDTFIHAPSTPCSYCKKSSSNFMFCCYPCELILCEECSEDETASTAFQTLSIKCGSGHLLKYYLNSANFNSRKFGSFHDIKCAQCEACWVGPSWTCRLCEFDLCLNCIEKVKRINFCFCLNGHALVPSYDKSRCEDCSICKLCKSSFYGSCWECEFGMCENCVEYENRNKVKDENVCSEGHRLVYSQDPYYLVFSIFKIKKIVCSMCEACLIENKVYHCRICFFQLCESCYKGIQKLTTLSVSEELDNEYYIEDNECKSLVLHKLLESEQNSFKDKLICKNCNAAFDYNDFLPIVITCGHTFCKQCVSQFNFFCPIDFKSIKNFKLNYSLQDLIDYKPDISKLPELKNLTNIQCPNRHFFRFLSTADSILRPNSTIPCKYCTHPCSKNLLYCELCNILLCEACSHDEKTRKSLSDHQVLCKKNHELAFYSNTSFFYSRRREALRRVRCNLCRECWVGGSWACRLCGYDLCYRCNERVQRFSRFVCNNNHQLDTCLSVDKVFNCSVCKIGKSQMRGQCELCNYSMCEWCANYYLRNKYINESCPNGHRLIYSEDSVYLYGLIELEITCNGCNSKIVEKKSFHCLPCFFNLCDTCFNTIQIGKKLETKLLCGLGHEMDYKFNTTQVSKRKLICDKCRKRCRLTGTFKCETCKFTLCLKCVHSILST